MKELLTTIAMAGFLVCPFVVSAAYIIHLKDGRDFVTEQYSEEGDQIKFERYGGLIGIRKDLVNKIEEIVESPTRKDKVSSVANESPNAAKNTPQAKEETVANQTNVVDSKDPKKREIAENGQKQRLAEKEESENNNTLNVADIERYKDQKKELMIKYRNAKKRLDGAILSNDKRARWEAKKELKDMHAKLTELIRELKSLNNGMLPDWWDEAKKSENPS